MSGVIDAVGMARSSRGTRLDGLRCHSDAGSQSASLRHGERLAEIGAVPSIGPVGDSFDNVLAQTVNGCYKAELIRGHARQKPWMTVAVVDLATPGRVHWHNTSRLHGYLGRPAARRVRAAVLGCPTGRPVEDRNPVSRASTGPMATQIAAAEQLRPALRAATYRGLSGLLAMTGMRVDEAIALAHTDVDLRTGVLVINEAKFGRHRRLPLHPSALAALRDHIAARRQLCPRPRASSFRAGRRAAPDRAPVQGGVGLSTAASPGGLPPPHPNPLPATSPTRNRPDTSLSAPAAGISCHAWWHVDRVHLGP